MFCPMPKAGIYSLNEVESEGTAKLKDILYLLITYTWFPERNKILYK
jgi:hypothetical protein